MIEIRKSLERGHFDHGWLDTWHTFSFAEYYDPDHMGYRSLRVINQDRVSPGEGFGTHPHRDMEILTYILEGALEHKDSMGTGSIIRAGELQRMTAGTGVTHSEFNASETEPVHLLQIWILPERKGLTPGYEQKHFDDLEMQGRLRLIASRDGRQDSVTIHQDVNVYAALLGRGQNLTIQNRPNRHLWLQIARGQLTINGKTFGEGDGLAAQGPELLNLVGGTERSEILCFDLA